jgi:hypothetical protein
MFHGVAAKPIDQKLQKLVEEITAENPHLAILAAREFRYIINQTPVEIYIQEPREFNILEEFIIRAGLEFSPPPSEDELASILGLDPIFIRSTTTNLQALETLAATSPITVTPKGRTFYAQGTVPQPAYPLQIYAVADALNGKLTFNTEPCNDEVLNLPDLAEFIKVGRKINDISALSLEKIQQCMQFSGLDFHAPELGKIVTACKVLAPPQIIWKPLSLLVIFDAVANKLSIEIRSGKEILASATERMAVLQSKGKIPWQSLCKLSQESINLEREATRNHQNDEIASRLEKLSQDAVKLTDAQVYHVWRNALKAAKRQVLIYSPCLSKDIINKELITLLQKLADKGVWILIAYDTPPSPEVEKKLIAIKTPDDLPSVQVLPLGNSSVKEVIVDQKIHLWGFYDWVKCDNEYLPCGESVYQVTVPQQVSAAYEFLAQRYQNYAQTKWDIAVENHDLQLAVKSLCVWEALGRENIALREIQESNWLELLPVWLNIIVQNFNSENLPDDAGILSSAFSLLTQVTGKETFMPSLREVCQKIMQAIASAKPEIAVNLLNQQVWADFIRLKVAHRHDTPHNFILPEKQKKHKHSPGAESKSQ